MNELIFLVKKIEYKNQIMDRNKVYKVNQSFEKVRFKNIFNKLNLELFVLSIFCFIVTNVSFSQVVTIPAGNPGTGVTNDPFGTYYGFERTALIYTSAEVGVVPCNITDVAFYLHSSTAPGDAVDCRIYMKERTTLFSTPTTYSSETTGATLVYGPTTIPASSFASPGWVTVNLVSPFTYTGGVNNLEIIIETNATSFGNEGATAKRFRQFPQASNQYYQYWFQDNTAPTGNGTLHLSRTNVQLTLASIPLPVELTSFGAHCLENEMVEISWLTDSEHNASHYFVEKSKDGIIWTALDTVQAVGNTSSSTKYVLNDYERVLGTVYYRLTQVDFDGNSELFAPVSLNCSNYISANSITTYPNPSLTDFTVEINCSKNFGESVLKVFDMRGSILKSIDVNLEKGTTLINLENSLFSPGFYYIMVENDQFQIAGTKQLIH